MILHVFIFIFIFNKKVYIFKDLHTTWDLTTKLAIAYNPAVYKEEYEALGF